MLQRKSVHFYIPWLIVHPYLFSSYCVLYICSVLGKKGDTDRKQENQIHFFFYLGPAEIFYLAETGQRPCDIELELEKIFV